MILQVVCFFMLLYILATRDKHEGLTNEIEKAYQKGYGKALSDTEAAGEAGAPDGAVTEVLSDE